MRSYLLVHAARDDDLDAALSSGADAVVVDLGDWAKSAEREQARAAARRFLGRARAMEGRPALYVRVAPLESAAIDGDLAAVAPAAPDGVFLSQACGGASIQHLSAKLAVQEAECGLEDGATRIVAMATQTPAAIFELGTYAGASRRLAGLAFDTQALRLSLGARGAPSAPDELAAPFALARALAVFGAAAARVAAIDAPFANADADGLRADCLAARRDGFAAKLAAYPAQIRVIKETFASDEPTL